MTERWLIGGDDETAPAVRIYHEDDEDLNMIISSPMMTILLHGSSHISPRFFLKKPPLSKVGTSTDLIFPVFLSKIISASHS